MSSNTTSNTSSSTATRSKQSSGDCTTVFVSNLPPSIDDQQLAVFFNQHINPSNGLSAPNASMLGNEAPVRSARVVLDRVTGKSKGIAYVDFHTAEAAKAAIMLSGTKISLIKPSPSDHDSKFSSSSSVVGAASVIRDARHSMIRIDHLNGTAISISSTQSQAMTSPTANAMPPEQSVMASQRQDIFTKNGCLPSIEHVMAVMHGIPQVVQAYCASKSLSSDVQDDHNHHHNNNNNSSSDAHRQ